MESSEQKGEEECILQCGEIKEIEEQVVFGKSKTALGELGDRNSVSVFISGKPE